MNLYLSLACIELQCRGKCRETETRWEKTAGVQVTEGEKVRKEVKRKRGILECEVKWERGRELCVSVVPELSLWVLLTDGIPDLRLTNHYPLSQLESVSAETRGQRDGETRLSSDVSMIYCVLVTGNIITLQTHISSYLSSFHLRCCWTNKEIHSVFIREDLRSLF